jgi:two-component system alkaline phosphatase synthesis response regulator PhoP
MAESFIDKKILIVEDDVPLLMSLKDQFTGEGFTVLTATDGQQGLDVVQKENPDLVLIDILLPKMDGIEMAKEIHKLGLGTLMMFLTNLNDPEHISEAIAIDITDYLVKSDWHINDVVARVKQKLSTKQ